ncbi:ABC transporter ATP-binding protein [Gammaproteobacteria bacterium]|jgi:ABC-2 type transport system ATP-binding protein|nr:ABC transporter ATP-binding protein [Gammaproteobacteria bacterium]
MQNDIVVKARGIKKKYSDNNALNGLDLDLHQGQILGLIGPNGAGKSTFLHAVLGLLKSEGSLEVMGLEPFKNRHQLLKKVCSITDVAVLPKWMTVEQMLEYVEGVHPEFDPEKARSILSKTNIKNTSKIRTLSRGMIVQLHLAIIMAIDAELLVLDEPTLGLDLVYRKEFYSRLIEDYFDGNKTILISTHQVEEIEGVLTDVVFLDKGQAVMNESIDSLNQRFLELRPNADNNEKAKSLNPINIRTELGRAVFLYENIDIEKLSSLGEVRPPFIADLFVAIMNRSDQSGEQS